MLKGKSDCTFSSYHIFLFSLVSPCGLVLEVLRNEGLDDILVTRGQHQLIQCSLCCRICVSCHIPTCKYVIGNISSSASRVEWAEVFQVHLCCDLLNIS